MAEEKNFQQNAQEQFEKAMNTPDSTNELDPQDIEKNKVMAVLAYCGILVLIPLMAAKESKFARFHCNQGIVLLVIELVLSVAGWYFPAGIAWIINLVNIAVGILAILGIINAIKGRAKELPLVGGLKVISGV
ncbi:MAG: zinc ribbon domain-containing protein [Bacteroidaceae bacterium]|nr:zinc ribbon domain-containing protein [Bacteroidaceae bacterium]